MGSDLSAILELLSPDERQELINLASSVTPDIWTPFPGPQTVAVNSDADILGFGGSAGGGKDLDLNADILTKNGFKKIGNIQVGETVLDENQKYCRVVACSEIFTNHNCYEVWFDNGSFLVTGEGHQWVTDVGVSRAVRTTAQICESLAAGHRVSYSDCKITDVVPVKARPTRCIQVDSPSRMYLAGRSMIPTHNSDLLLGLALTRHKRSIIFRREALQSRGLMDRLNEITGGVGRLNENLGVWRDGLRQIEFAGVKDVGDEQRHKGRPHSFVGFDEGDFFLEFQVRFLLGWMRTTDPTERCRCVICFNPPNSPEGRWVIQFFAPWLDKKHPNPAEPGELRWYASLPDANADKSEVERPNGLPFECYNERLKRNEVITPMSRTFIPSRVFDNPALMGTSYVQVLQGMQEPFRSQLLYGDFNISQKDDPYQIIPTAWVEAAMERWKPDGGETFPLTAVGVDPSRGGTDSTTISRRHLTWFDRIIKIQGEDTDDGPKVRDAVMRAIDGRNNVDINIDVIGVGASAYDALVEIGSKQFRVHAINFSESAPGMDKACLIYFVNMRSWAYWYLRECLDPKDGDGLALPPDPELLADLTAPRWCMRPGGVLVEPKEDIQKRIGRSPDKGDSCVYSNLIVQGIDYSGLILG